MEKICIVKRRREYAQPEIKVTQAPEMNNAIAPEVVVNSLAIETKIEIPENKPEISTVISSETVADYPHPEEETLSVSEQKLIEELAHKTASVISITLTKEQSDRLQQSDYIKELLNGSKKDPSLEIKINPNGQLSLNYKYTASFIIRMLSAHQVCQMLQISRSFLQKLVHENRMKSYKLGRLRRFLLEDVLDYLSNDKDFAGFKGEQ
jgi:excisionase family DNA binding protein